VYVLLIETPYLLTRAQTARMDYYTVFRKKHPLAFSFISP